MKSLFNKSCFLSNIATQTKSSRPARRKASHHARCNLCDRLYRAATSHHRFCKSCRSEDELFKFAEWLPQS